MSSQTDLDQGGTARQWVLRYMGPSIGWIYAPGLNPLNVLTGAGTVQIDRSTNFVQVNASSAVILKLPQIRPPSSTAGVLPARFMANPIIIEDAGGHGDAFPITIQPFDITETVLGLTQIQITVKYGAFTLQPNPAFLNWVSGAQ